MNERILALALQAKHRLDQDIKDGKKDWKNTPQSYDEMVQEKFAELIVRECRVIVAKTRDQAIEDEWNVDEAMSTAMFDIEEHFGV